MRQLVYLIVIVGFYYNPVFAQISDGAKNAAKIELFALPGYEELPRPKYYQPDTANIRPENFSFRIWDKKDLEDRLSIGVDLPPVSCKLSWGLFIFRVNGLGRVDSTRYDGNLAPTTLSKILSNICTTDSNWIIKPGTKPNHVAWFAYPFFDIRGMYSKQLGCSASYKELLKPFPP